MRRLSQDDITRYLQSVYLDTRSISTLLLDNIKRINKYETIILPDDSFHRSFVKRFKEDLPTCIFENCFLRWDRMPTLNKDYVITDLTISDLDLRKFGLFQFVERAESEAQRSPDWWRQVGAVLVKDGSQILTAFNQHLPTELETYFSGDPRSNFNAGEYIELSVSAHAEAGLIALAAKKGIVTKECELFVTTFPCPPCAISITLSGIKRVFFVEGYSMINSVEIFKEYGVEVVRVIK